MIEVKGITKVFGTKVAVDNISFEVADGEIMGFLGPNGAGKSTTMNILTGYLSATSGRAIINGTDIFENPKKAKKEIGFLPELPPLYPDMTVYEYLKFVSDLKGVKEDVKKHIEGIADMTGITDVLPRVIKNLSKGYRQRVGIAEALVGSPRVLIFDEPTVGLDPGQIIEIRELIKALGKTHTVILSTHILPEVQAVCDRIVIINNGKIVADEKTGELIDKTAGVRTYKLTVDANGETIASAIGKLDGVVSSRVDSMNDDGVVIIIEASPAIDVRKPIFNLLSKIGCPILGLENVSLSLEDIFIKLTKKEGN